MIDKQINRIDKNDLDELVKNGIPESKTLEYKEALPGNSDADKKELLADVSSFANTSGGDIVYGIAEKRDTNGKPTGVPESAPGLKGINVDQEVLRMESIIRDGVAPRIPGIQFQAVSGLANGSALVLRVSKSWISPHMLNKSDSRFYSRDTRGKFSMDVDQIRSAFQLSESLLDKVKNFRLDRVSRIMNGETPVKLIDAPKIILHVLPLQSFGTVMNLDSKFLENEGMKLKPMIFSSWDGRHNIDGYASYAGIPREDYGGYVQAFRSGVLEAVDAAMLGTMKSTKQIPAKEYEEELQKVLRICLNFLKISEIKPPIFVTCTFVGVKDFQMNVKTIKNLALGKATPIDRDILTLPDVEVVDYDVNVGRLLKPIFDAVWQAAGWPGSHNYGADGNWENKSY